MRTLLSLVSLLFLALGPTSAASSSRDVTCPTCSGKGEAVLPCAPCGASGKADCRQCGPLDLLASLRDNPNFADATDAEREELEKTIAKIEETQKKLAEMGLGGVHEEGYVGCPASCSKGRPIPQPSDICRVCSGKGKFACPSCKKKGTIKCLHCSGRRKASVVCPDCTGSGQLPDPSAKAGESAAACLWCGDQKVRACHACDAHGKRVETCHACLGERKAACKTCHGTQRKKCNKCHSTGNLKAFFGKKNSNRCDKCKAKGYLACTSCKNGAVPCGACPKSGVFEQDCRACKSRKKLACSGCSAGAHRAWDVSAAVLAGAGDREGAALFLEVALARAEQQNEVLRAAFAGDGRERRAYEKELGLVTQKLEERLAAARGE